MSEQLTLPAEARDRAGKGASRALRREGRVPAVVYGEKKEALSIHVEEKLLTKMLHSGHFMNSVVMIDVGGKDVTDLPPQFLALCGDVSPAECMQLFIVSQFLILFMLMPLIIPVSIAAYSIVGEKTTRSLEPLLATPVTTAELLVGKSLAAAYLVGSELEVVLHPLTPFLVRFSFPFSKFFPSLPALFEPVLVVVPIFFS